LAFTDAGCPIIVKECWAFNSYLNIFSIYKALSEERPDAVFFNLQFLKFGDKKIPAALGLMLPFVCRLKGLPTISLIHNILEQVDLESAGFTKNKALQKIYGLIGSTLTRFVLASDIVAVTIGKYVGILEKKYKARNIALVPHGAFETPPEPDYKLPQGPKQVMAFGKFGTYKKVELMIEAVERIRERSDVDIEIVIAGTDSPNTPGYLEGVRKKYSHVPQIRFTGYVEESDVPKIFADSAVVVFPYTSTTGSSGVLHQAGSYGKAVALPDLGDLGILVRDEGYQGEFFEPYSAESLSNAIERILVNEKYREKLGKINYKAACSLPMSEITQMYLDYFVGIQLAKKSGYKLDLENIDLKEHANS
ncbi:MAG: glycosyltransferase, partial [Flavobacteriaceae bacterium]